MPIEIGFVPTMIEITGRGLRYTIADVAWAHVEQTRIYRRMLAFLEEVDVRTGQYPIWTNFEESAENASGRPSPRRF